MFNKIFFTLDSNFYFAGEVSDEMGLRPGQGSPRVSGSDQVDNDPMTTPRSSGVKLEDNKPLLRDREANTVKSGKKLI